MTSISHAQKLIIERALPQGSENVPLEQARTRILANDIVAQRTVPPFDRSPLDGFAFAAADTFHASSNQPVRLLVVGVIGAGEVWTQSLQRGQCLRIMTGAPIPLGADAVAAIEKVTVGHEHIMIDKRYQSGENVARAGEDMEAGRLVMQSGRVLGAAETGILASLGLDRVPVYLRPKVTVIATGSELMPVGSTLTPGKIYDSNSTMLSNLAAECGAFVVSRELAGDGQVQLTAALEKALAVSDVVITSGGVSVGDYDLTREAVLAVGAEILFHRVAMKPGTPMLAAVKDKKLLLCLSGNPGAACVTFWVFVRPALLRLQGHSQWQQPRISASLNHPLEKKGCQNRFIRAVTRFRDGVWVVDVLGRERPGVLSSLHEANSLIFLPAEAEPLAAGDSVEVMLIGNTVDYFTQESA